MILRALYDYYQRCENVAPEGYEFKEIGFLIVISKEGDFLRIEDCRIDNRRCSTFLVPKTVKRSGSNSGMFPCLLWDNIRFVAGISRDKKIISPGQYIDAFRLKVKELSNKYPQSEGICAVDKFYEKHPERDLSAVLAEDDLYNDILETTKNISFRVQGELKIVAEDPFLREEIKRSSSENEKICLVTGRKGEIARIHSKTPLPGSTFSSLISFQKGSGFDSYGKEQAYNAPISTEAEFAYTTAINRMLSRESHNKFSVGNRVFLFWASSDGEAAKASEESVFAFFCRQEEDDDPNKRIDVIRQTFMAIYNGKLPTSENDRFFILGLVPNSARIAVVYWAELPLKRFAKIICRHFDDMEIVDTRKERKTHVGLHSILGAVTFGGKSSDASPNLPDAVVKSIFQGTPYPASLYQACIRRIRAEVSKESNGRKDDSVNVIRAAIIKAYLNRLKDNNKDIEVMLDKENQNQGYLCGRLFAVLDKIQEEANGIHSIRERYMNSASATPAAVFATILNLSTHHNEKLAPVRQVYYEKLKQEIITKLDADGFPSHLDLQDQGRFFVGYYQQRQDFFTSKSNNE